MNLDDKLVVAISSRALFNFEEENDYFEREGPEAYRAMQLERLALPAPPGVAYPLITKLLALNTERDHRVEVVILSRNDPVSGLRVFRSAAELGLPLTRGVFTRGDSPYAYLTPLNATLFLSADAADVHNAIRAGFAAARVYTNSGKAAELHPDEIRVAFDGDAVLFGDEAERVFQSAGLNAFQQHEAERASQPLPGGPFKPVLQALHRLRAALGAESPMTIRTALVTSRCSPAHERTIRTLMHWGVEVDEAMFLGGLDKGPFLREFAPDFYFDDQIGHCDSASLAGPTGQVLYGIAACVPTSPENLQTCL